MVSLAYIGRNVVDGLANFVSGIGTGKDKASQYTYTYSPLDQRTIEAAYATDWLARKIIDVLPQDMCREWRVWQWDKASDCYELEKELKVRTKVRRALKLARLYGGSAILIGDGSDRPEKPLDVEKIGKGDLKYLHVFSRHQLSNDREKVKELKNADYGLAGVLSRCSAGLFDRTARPRSGSRASLAVRLLRGSGAAGLDP